MRILQIFFMLFFVNTILPSFAQTQYSPDTSITQLQRNNTIERYYNSLDVQAGLYNGSEYIVYVSLLKDGHPYLDTTTLTIGTVLYDGMVYNNVPMLYDIVKDELIAQHFNKVFYIQLVHSKVDEFNILNRAFKHLGVDSTKKGNVRNGFYELLYDGNIKLYAKRIKTIQEYIPDMKIERRVFTAYRYFIYKDDVYHEVFNESSVLKVLDDKKTMLKQALRKQRIKFRKQREAAMKLMLHQYENTNP